MKRRDLLRMPVKAALEGVAPVLERGMRPPPGSAPGVLQSMPGATAPRVDVFAYGPHEITEFEAEDLPAIARLRGHYPVIWVNVNAVDHAETVQAIGDGFGLHRLALEDVMHVTQRPKVEAYDGHLFIVVKMARRAPDLDLEQVGIFLGRDFVVTFQQHPGDVFDTLRERLRAGHARLRAAGPDYLAYSVLDAIIDNYFPVVEEFVDELEALENEIMERPSHHCVQRLHDIKRELMALRRSVWPLREALGVLVRDPGALVHAETVVYLRDCQDHAYQILDLVENFREVAGSLADLYISTVGNRTNDIMKVLTIFAALFIPLSFITGIYGMNLAHPETAPAPWYWTWPFAAAVMGAIAFALLVFFYRRGWIRGRG
ncbi:MAG TPA: magnesium/cobalt transporter CorA [Longimicrobium sp.]|nr:magnesium/cobalt transporter CorA [Longimicrobium sp.]